jgi:hypothetical protein
MSVATGGAPSVLSKGRWTVTGNTGSWEPERYTAAAKCPGTLWLHPGPWSDPSLLARWASHTGTTPGAVRYFFSSLTRIRKTGK